MNTHPNPLIKVIYILLLVIAFVAGCMFVLTLVHINHQATTDKQIEVIHDILTNADVSYED